MADIVGEPPQIVIQHQIDEIRGWSKKIDHIYEKFWERRQQDGESSEHCARLYYINGKVIIFEVPSPPHEAGGGKMFNLIYNPIVVAGHGDHFELSANPSMLVDNGQLLQPDVTLDSVLRPNDPNAPSVDGIGHPYLGAVTTVRIVIGIKIFKRRRAPQGQQRPFALIVMLYQRGVNQHPQPLPQGVSGPIMAPGTEKPTAIVSFGTAPPDIDKALPTIINVLVTPAVGGVGGVNWQGLGHGNDPACNAMALPLYQLPIPVAELYNGAIVGNPPTPFAPPANMPVNINVDLFSIQQAVSRDFVDDGEEHLDDSEAVVGKVAGAETKVDPKHANLRVKSAQPSEMTRAPTTDEMAEFRETNELFNSNLFRLQMVELFKELRVNYTKTTALESALHALKTALETMPDHVVKAKKAVDVTLFAGAPESLAVSKPAAVELVGSYMLRTTSRSAPNVDVGVQLPEPCFVKGDVADHLYHSKRNHYMHALAAYLVKNPRFSNLELTDFAGDTNKQIIVIRPSPDPTTNARTSFIIRIIPYIPRALIRIDTRLTPKFNNLTATESTTGRVETFRDSELDQDTVDTEYMAKFHPKTKSTAPAYKPFSATSHSVFYNNSIVEDVMVHEHVAMVHERLKNAPILVDTILLLKAWLQVKRVPTVTGFHLTMIAIHLYVAGRITKAMSAYQAFRMVLVFITKDMHDGRPIFMTLEDNSTLKQGQFADIYSRMYPVTLVDPSGLLNLTSRITSWGASALHREASAALVALDSGDGFSQTFLQLASPHLKWDYVLRVGISSGTDVPATDYYSSERLLEHRIYRTLVLALTNRVHVVSILPAEPRQWSVGSKPVQSSVIHVGLLLNPSQWQRYVDMGPSADHTDAAVFRALWGAKSQLRRFKDGSINEAVSWDTTQPRNLVIEQLAKYILQSRLKINPTTVCSLTKRLDSVIAREDSTLEIMAAKDKLIRAIQSLSLPLAINGFQSLSQALRYTSVSATSSPIEILLDFEQSRFWTADYTSIQALKTAFLLKIAREFKGTPFHPRLTETHLDVRVDKYLFRLIPYYAKEIEVLSGPAAVAHSQLMNLHMHHSLIQALYTGFPCFGPTAVLAQRWIAAHHLTGYIAPQTIELMVAAVFRPTSKGVPPVTPLLGFLRFLRLVSTFEWDSSPLIVDFLEMSRDQESSIRSLHEAAVKANAAMPLFYIATEKDQSATWWRTSNSNAEWVRTRLVTLAKRALEMVAQHYYDTTDNFQWLNLFETSLVEYDVIINLRPSLILDADISIASLTSATPIAPSKYNAKFNKPGFDGVQTFVQQLNERFSEYCTFCYDGFGGSKICMKWKDTANTSFNFKPSKAQYTMPLDGKELIPHKLEIVAEFSRLGGSLVNDISFIKHTEQQQQ
eukprot:gene8229-9676_t